MLTLYIVLYLKMESETCSESWFFRAVDEMQYTKTNEPSSDTVGGGD
jgi:hypothetical protein